MKDELAAHAAKLAIIKTRAFHASSLAKQMLLKLENERLPGNYQLEQIGEDLLAAGFAIDELVDLINGEETPVPKRITGKTDLPGQAKLFDTAPAANEQ